MIGTNRNSWIKIVFACLLLVGLPIFIWAVLTQRIELRKRAATAEPTEICWNRVIPYNDSYSWPNSCKGNPRTDLTCTPILIPLTTEEIAGYQTWVSMGKPYIPGCGPAPSTTPSLVIGLQQVRNAFTSSDIKFGDTSKKVLFLEIGDPSCPYCHIAGGKDSELNTQYGQQFKLIEDGGTYEAPVPVMKKLIDSGQAAFALIYYPGHGNGEMGMKALYCAFEKGNFWPVNDLIMSNAGYTLLNDVVKNDTTKSGALADFLSSVVDSSFMKSCLDSGKYDAQLSKEKAIAAGLDVTGTPTFFINATLFAGAQNYTAMISTVNAALGIEMPTPTPTICTPNGSACTVTICPPMPVCPPGTACPQVMPPCTVRPGICQNNRCVPTYPSPTRYPTPSYYTTPTPTPASFCARGTPIVRITPENQSGNPGQTLTYTASITNTDLQGCASSLFALSTQVDTNFTAQNVSTIIIPSLSTANVSFTVTSPAIDPYTDTRSIPVTFRATHTVSNQSASATVAYTLVKPAPQQLKFLVRLAGVSGAEAKGATMNVKLKLKNGTVLPLDRPLVLEPVGNGVYSATATLTNPLPAGTSFRMLVKGEKHSQIEFCRESGQTVPCNDTDYITPTSYSFDFTGRPLPPGDLNQDGKVNADDIKLITDLFKKPSSQLTAADLKSADVDYSGTIDAYDLNLVLQTLETRYDEQ